MSRTREGRIRTDGVKHGVMWMECKTKRAKHVAARRRRAAMARRSRRGNR